MDNSTVKSQLKRTLGLPSLFAVAVGVVVAQAVFVSILQGVGIGGAAFFVALLIAFIILTLCYVFTFSELALMLRKGWSQFLHRGGNWPFPSHCCYHRRLCRTCYFWPAGRTFFTGAYSRCLVHGHLWTSRFDYRGSVRCS